MRNIIAICGLLILIPAGVGAQGSAFNFQGRLSDGTTPANGRYDLQFRLFDAVVGGSPVGAVVSRPGTTLINGVFSVALDFGAAAFNSPNNIFVEISLRPTGSPNAFTILGPRQQLTVAPLALHAATATNADNATNAVNAVTANTAMTAATAEDANNFGGSPPSHYAKLNSSSNLGSLDIEQHIVAGSYLHVFGDATQALQSFGIAKAMLEVTYPVQGQPTLRCFNGVDQSAGNNCGFVVTVPLSGVIRINFGFPIANRFVSVSAQYQSSLNNNNTGVNYRPFDSTSIEVFTFEADSEDTIPRSFTLILY